MGSLPDGYVKQIGTDSGNIPSDVSGYRVVKVELFFFFLKAFVTFQEEFSKRISDDFQFFSTVTG